ncbi:hydroxysqualene dehydroxylase HpnE [Neisseria wadsworthii]|uniref:Amine oxidase n=1 Tax=Neisseria wadsworthii 9715 TaxID=1030841 RepID=G4CSG1_9NEIS|nr:hydroxysqualene dehydroxylase HpnE [Neisseria wadsworthii]EGZ44777.1 amine oxidase [Neisseria wadsworthii 9715]QMT35649.1 FAD-dependent oxidoreductase [Neisseria wadsworthii]
MKINRKPKIAVIGAGWSGLAAAVSLCRKADITVFEAGKAAGGRARTLNADKGGFAFLDNGQHILIGAYHGVRTLLEHIDVKPENVFLRQPLQWHMADGMKFQTGILPAPLHILTAVLGAKDIGLADKLGLLWQMSVLQKRQPSEPDEAVAPWLRVQRASRRQLAEFWTPLVLGALNTPLEKASLNTLCHVLRDGVWAEKSAGDFWLPKCSLGELLPEPAVACLKKYHAQVRLGERASALECLPYDKVGVNGQTFDAVIPAVAPYHIAALLPKGTPEAFRQALDTYRYHAITTVYLRYREEINLPAAMTGLASGTAQWLLDRGRLGVDRHEVAAVISVSETLGLSNEALATQVHADVARICPNIGRPQQVRVITEKRATVASTVNRVRPDCAWLHHKNIYPAGDYLHPHYPATLEAAVQSGQQAAALAANRLNL